MLLCSLKPGFQVLKTDDKMEPSCTGERHHRARGTGRGRTPPWHSKAVFPGASLPFRGAQNIPGSCHGDTDTDRRMTQYKKHRLIGGLLASTLCHRGTGLSHERLLCSCASALETISPRLTYKLAGALGSPEVYNEPHNQNIHCRCTLGIEHTSKHTCY